MASELRVDQLKYSSAGSGTTPNITLNSKGTVNFGSNIDIGGSLLVQGAPFTTLPTQYASGENSTVGAVLKSDGTNAFWETSVSFEDGFNITKGYPIAGYRGGSSWRNVNRCTHSTQSMANLGDQITYSDAYTAGARNSAGRAYVFCTANGWNSTGNAVSTFNMVSESNGGTSTNMSTSRNRTSVMQRDFKYAYVCGNNNDRPDRFDLTNDGVTTVSGSGGSGGDNPACGYGEKYGWYKQGGNGYSFAWATESWSSWNNRPGTDGTNKTWSTRKGHSYWNESGGYQTNTALTRRNDETGSNLGSVGKPGTTGEETNHTGMSYGFMNGMYNGQQNNQGGWINLSSHSFSWNGSLNSTGTSGRASGAAVEWGTLASGYTGI